NADVVYPAADPNVFGVSVVRSNDTFPTTTLNRGPGIDLLAPGSGVPVALRGTTGYAASAEATSYATPFVSGAAALLLQLNPTFTPAQVIQTFKDSGKTVTDTSTGFTYSGRSYKRINLYDALRLASDRYTTQSNFLGTAIASNTTIQAENFDAGTDGVAYHDVDAGATSTLTRTSGAELVATTDAGGGYAIGSTRAGEWLEYTVNFATAGNFTFGARLASLAAGGRFHVEVDGVDATGPLTVQATGSAATWANMASAPFAVTAGRHVVRVAFDAAGSAGIVASFNHFYFTSVAYTSVNIGPSLGATTAVQAPSAYNLSSNGADIWGRSDSFRFVYRPVTGNFDAVVRVASLGATSPWSKAGLMVRDSLAANSRNVFALVTPGSNGYRMQTRTVAGGLSTLVGGTAAVAYPNTWVRLTRVGNVFTAYRSTDGTNWTAYATTTLALNSTVYLGVALSSGNAALTNGVKFRGMRV
ncbi:MAG: carbohydrate-binding protein, partial [Phycisphaerae bacterium]